MAARATFSNRATRLSAWSREVQQMAVTFVKYGSAAYVIRKYLVGVSAVSAAGVP